jgi:hypothetical protein
MLQFRLGLLVLLLLYIKWNYAFGFSYPGITRLLTSRPNPNPNINISPLVSIFSDANRQQLSCNPNPNPSPSPRNQVSCLFMVPFFDSYNSNRHNPPHVNACLNPPSLSPLTATLTQFNRNNPNPSPRNLRNKKQSCLYMVPFFDSYDSNPNPNSNQYQSAPELAPSDIFLSLLESQLAILIRSTNITHTAIYISSDNDDEYENQYDKDFDDENPPVMQLICSFPKVEEDSDVNSDIDNDIEYENRIYDSDNGWDEMEGKTLLYPIQYQGVDLGVLQTKSSAILYDDNETDEHSGNEKMAGFRGGNLDNGVDRDENTNRNMDDINFSDWNPYKR